MHALITAWFKTSAQAREAQESLLYLPSAHLQDVADSLIVTADPDGTFRLEQAVNFWTTECNTLSLIQLLRWTLFVQPLLGIMNGSAVNRLRDALDDFGITADFAATLQAELLSGHSALVVLPRAQSAEVVMAVLQPLAVASDNNQIEGLYDKDLREAFCDVLDLIKVHHKTFKITAA